MHKLRVNLFALNLRTLNLKITTSYLQQSEGNDEVAMDNYQRHFEDLTVRCR